MNKLPLSHRAKRSQIHATALLRHVGAMRAVQDKSHVSRHGARTVQRTQQNPHMPRKLSSSCDQNIRSLAVAPTSALAITCRRLLSLAPATDGIRQVSGVRGEVRAGRRERAQRAAGLSGATEAAKDRACARATEDLWPLAGAGSGHVARAYLQRPTLRNTCRAPLGDHVSSMLDGDLEAVVGGAKWCSTCDNRKWASSVHAFERALPAGRAGSGCCSELPADLLSS